MLASAEACRVMEQADDADRSLYRIADRLWQNQDEQEPFALMLVQQLCEEASKKVKGKYPDKGAAWKRSVEKTLREYAVSLGMRLTKIRMERARYG